MRCVSFDWSTIHKHGNLWWRLLQHRHDVFVNELGWDLPTCEKIAPVEFDQYDTPNAVYFVVLDDNDEIAASARVAPCNTQHRVATSEVSYMIRDAAKGLLDGIPSDILIDEPPTSSDVWEITRLSSRSGKAVRILAAAFNAFLAVEGATRMISLSPVALMRRMRAIGFESAAIGPAVNMDGIDFAVISTKIDYTAANIVSHSMTPVPELTSTMAA